MEFTYILSVINKYNSLIPINSEEDYKSLSELDKMFLESWLNIFANAICKDLDQDKVKKLINLLK